MTRSTRTRSCWSLPSSRAEVQAMTTPFRFPERLVDVRGLGKLFTLHNQGGIRLPVLQDVDFDAARGECLVLSGPSGTGKSTLLRCLYGNYLATAGSIRL